MLRFSNVMICLLLVFPTQLPAWGARNGQPQSPVSADTSSEEMPQNATPQNAPCVGQPKSGRELAASFQEGRLPAASQVTGTWVEIGTVSDYTSPRYRSLNCSGEKRGSKFEFVLVANGYSVELHAIGTDLQKVTMTPDHKGSVEFTLDLEADGAHETYRCRLTKRSTLACLDGAFSGAEFKKMNVEPRQIY